MDKKYAQVNKTTLMVVAVLSSMFEPEFDEKTMSENLFVECDDSIKQGMKYENNEFIELKEQEASKQNKLEQIALRFQAKREALKPKDDTLLELWKEQEKEALLYGKDAKSKMPVIETLSNKLGIDKADYVDKVNKKVEAYKIALADILADEYIEENKIIKKK